MNKAIFLDRDGTINADFGYVYRTEQLEFLPGAVEALRLFATHGYKLIVITNQSGIGRGYYTLADAEAFNRHMSRLLRAEGVDISDYYICPHAPGEACTCRKPQPQMIELAMAKHGIDPALSYMIGDKESDVECGLRAGVTGCRITAEHDLLWWAKRILHI